MNVLLVEDDDALGRLTSTVLGAAGHDVRWVRSVGDARVAIDAAVPDVVLTDLRLPGERGAAVAAHARAAGCARVVAVSGDPPEAGEAEAFDLVLQKPVANRDLVAALTADAGSTGTHT